MLVKLFEKIQQAAAPLQYTLNGRPYISGDVHPVKDPLPAALNVSNLSSLVDYVKNVYNTIDGAEGEGQEPIFIHVLSPTEAQVVSTLVGDFCQRKFFLAAQQDFAWSKSGQFMSPEQFIIMIQSMFVPDETTASLLKVIGNIEDSQVKKFCDDGVTQAVTASAGIVRRDVVALPSRLTLTPYRSFIETEQVPSQFILRMQSAKGEGNPPQIALFEADGGAWKNQAMKNVRAYLKSNLPEGTVVLA